MESDGQEAGGVDEPVQGAGVEEVKGKMVPKGCMGREGHGSERQRAKGERQADEEQEEENVYEWARRHCRYRLRMTLAEAGVR